MPVIAVANPKGGVGKSTLATNIAGWLASTGRAVMLGDVDRQQSSAQWLALRATQLPPIRGWAHANGDVLRPPRGTQDAVLDTPAGIKGKRLDAVLRVADLLLVPLQPSLFDIQATDAFVRALVAHPRSGSLRIGLVGMRVREHTIANERLHSYLATLPVPVVAWLRETQNYVHLAAHGLTLWDVAPARVERDLEQWAPLVAWLGR